MYLYGWIAAFAVLAAGAAAAAAAALMCNPLYRLNCQLAKTNLPKP